MADDLEYRRCYGLDLIVGTKEQIQSFGIGLNVAFPDEDGAPEYSIETVDPRGFRVMVYKRPRGRFEARVHFPNVHEYPQPWSVGSEREGIEVWPGVKKTAQTRLDAFTGSGDALVAAGIVREEQLPRPGRVRSTSITWRADGTIASQGSNDHGRLGNVSIFRHGKNRFTVHISVSMEERERRGQAKEDALDAARETWKRQVEAMPQPAMLERLPQWQLNRLATVEVVPFQPRSNVINMQGWKAARSMKEAHHG